MLRRTFGVLAATCFRLALWSFWPTPKPTVGGEIQLTDALDAVLAEEEMYAVVISDEDGFDTGTVETWLDTNNKLYARKNG